MRKRKAMGTTSDKIMVTNQHFYPVLFPLVYYSFQLGFFTLSWMPNSSLNIIHSVDVPFFPCRFSFSKMHFSIFLIIYLPCNFQEVFCSFLALDIKLTYS